MVALAEATPRPMLAEPRTAGRSDSPLFELDGVTLEDRILGVWEDLVADGRAECPVCGGRLDAVAGCGACGSELS